MTKAKLLAVLGAFSILGPTDARAAIPPKNVRLACAPLPYVIDCSVSRMANPEYSSHCWMVGPDGRSLHMKTDYRFNFFNGVVGLHLNNNLLISANLQELATGRTAFCTELREH